MNDVPDWASKAKIQIARADSNLIKYIDEIAAAVVRPDIVIYFFKWREAGYPRGALYDVCSLLMCGALKVEEAENYIAECQARDAFDPDGLCDEEWPV